MSLVWKGSSAVAACLLLTACVTGVSPYEPGEDHPANPHAAAALQEQHPLLRQSYFDAPAASGKYTCPMHPEIIRDQPGTCPICEMDLVPMAEEKEGAHEHP